ncbi:hypothetical protein BS47DRAFT_243131 [Hydnum rufescens UP504]|uniref:CCL2-like lectin domain-containing protein n=1 Tax=Hydnum rufescens UP504 TaxID=1448309 RepID=A0A9P6AM29_9AGAM|nr:hypothetical protein BS47DRAFT_1384814 [Hydnum rufescens UP504]KAF9508294.1 hypothetical protein BS47DRAFT_243131 [Hydnum rufescens UP504]
MSTYVILTTLNGPGGVPLAVRYVAPNYSVILEAFTPHNIPNNQKWRINPAAPGPLLPITAEDEEAVQASNLIVALSLRNPVSWRFNGDSGTTITNVNNGEVWAASQLAVGAPVTIGADTGSPQQSWNLRRV